MNTVEDFRSIEFGICVLTEDGEFALFKIPIDDSVRGTLVEMYNTFYNEYNSINEELATFQPSEKYSPKEKLTIDFNSEYLEEFRSLFRDVNIPVADANMDELANNIKFYFGIFRYRNNAKHIAIKRPSQFKGLLKKRLISFVDDTLKLVGDNVFKLDNDFDFVIHGNEIDILHPTSFIFLAKIEEEILRTAAEATSQLSRRIRFVDFVNLSEFVGSSKTAAKLVSSIKSRDDLEQTSREKLVEMCHTLGVNLREQGGRLIPTDEHIIQFLQILDRREYDVDLTDNQPEIYVAASRKRLN